MSTQDQLTRAECEEILNSSQLCNSLDPLSVEIFGDQALLLMPRLVRSYMALAEAAMPLAKLVEDFKSLKYSDWEDTPETDNDLAEVRKAAEETVATEDWPETDKALARLVLAMLDGVRLVENDFHKELEQAAREIREGGDVK